MTSLTDYWTLLPRRLPLRMQYTTWERRWDVDLLILMYSWSRFEVCRANSLCCVPLCINAARKQALLDERLQCIELQLFYNCVHTSFASLCRVHLHGCMSYKSQIISYKTVLSSHQSILNHIFFFNFCILFFWDVTIRVCMQRFHLPWILFLWT